MRACFKKSTESPATNMQQPTLGTSHLILGDSLVRELQILRISWISNRMVFGVATIAQLYRMVELMNPGRIVGVMILIRTNNASRSSNSKEEQWEAILVCLLTAVWQKFQCAVLAICTIPMSTTTQSATARRHNKSEVEQNSA